MRSVPRHVGIATGSACRPSHFVGQRIQNHDQKDHESTPRVALSDWFLVRGADDGIKPGVKRSETPGTGSTRRNKPAKRPIDVAIMKTSFVDDERVKSFV
jgi:hypothetical protein